MIFPVRILIDDFMQFLCFLASLTVLFFVVLSAGINTIYVKVKKYFQAVVCKPTVLIANTIEAKIKTITTSRTTTKVALLPAAVNRASSSHKPSIVTSTVQASSSAAAAAAGGC